MMAATLTLAIPSKGRLKDQCEAWLGERGLTVRQTGGERGYSAVLDGFGSIHVRLASASEIGKALLNGEIDLGITGEDVVREASDEVDEKIDFLARLGFGRADVVVAVPNGWIDVDTMADLSEVAADLRRKTAKRFRIATKFTRLTSQFLALHHVTDHRLVESAGATEGAPAAGIAEAIVDITTSGATLSANALKIISDGTILKSQSCLLASRTAVWCADKNSQLATLSAKLGL
jgi:ATP phosphoribosyltransferase